VSATSIPDLPNEGDRDPLYAHARTELDRAGLLAADAEYNGFLGRAVLALVKLFCEQGHSGTSAELTLDLFNTVARRQPLTPLTADKAEWKEVSDGVWQSTRRPTTFSRNAGRTWYDLDDDSLNNGDTVSGEIWVQLLRGEYRVGTIVRVKEDAYKSSARDHNGRRGVVVSTHTGDVKVRYDGSAVDDFSAHAPENLERLVT